MSQEQLLVIRIFRGNKNYIYSQLGQRGAAKLVTASILRSAEEGSYCGTSWGVFTHLADDLWTWCTSESDF